MQPKSENFVTIPDEMIVVQTVESSPKFNITIEHDLICLTRSNLTRGLDLYEFRMSKNQLQQLYNYVFKEVDESR